MLEKQLKHQEIPFLIQITFKLLQLEFHHQKQPLKAPFKVYQ